MFKKVIIICSFMKHESSNCCSFQNVFILVFYWFCHPIVLLQSCYLFKSITLVIEFNSWEKCILNDNQMTWRWIYIAKCFLTCTILYTLNPFINSVSKNIIAIKCLHLRKVTKVLYILGDSQLVGRPQNLLVTEDAAIFNATTFLQLFTHQKTSEPQSCRSRAGIRVRQGARKRQPVRNHNHLILCSHPDSCNHNNHLRVLRKEWRGIDQESGRWNSHAFLGHFSHFTDYCGCIFGCILLLSSTMVAKVSWQRRKRLHGRKSGLEVGSTLGTSLQRKGLPIFISYKIILENCIQQIIKCWKLQPKF